MFLSMFTLINDCNAYLDMKHKDVEEVHLLQTKNNVLHQLRWLYDIVCFICGKIRTFLCCVPSHDSLSNNHHVG